MPTSEQLEHEAEVARAKIVDSLAELRDRLTPSAIIGDALGYARDGKVGALAQSFGQQIANNPLPATLIGAGFAWLLFAGNRTSRRDSPRAAERAASTSHRAERKADSPKKKAPVGASDVSDRAFGGTQGASETPRGSGRSESIASEAWAAAWDAGSTLTRKAGDAGASLAGAAGSAGHAAASVSHAASSIYGATAKGARHTAGVINRSAEAVVGGSHDVVKFLKDEPLVLAGIALALGAAVGATLPLTDAEGRLMGKASDSVKRDAAAAAEEAWEKGKEVVRNAAEKAWNEMKHAAQEEGLAPEGGDAADGRASTASSTNGASPADDIAERDVVRPSS